MENTKNAFWLILLILWASPWLLLIVEGVSLFLTGSVLTSIPWDHDRVGIALVTPAIVGFIAAGLSG